MEMRLPRLTNSPWVRMDWLVFILLAVFTRTTQAQAPVKKYLLKDGKMIIELSKNIKVPTLDSFIVQFNLADLPIKKFLQPNAVELWSPVGLAPGKEQCYGVCYQ